HGEQAFVFLQRMITQDLNKATADRAAYTLMCNERGGIIDDFLVYRLQPDRYLLIVNAANHDTDLAHLQAEAANVDGVTVDDVSADWALLALQGPQAAAILAALGDEAFNERMANL